MLAEAIQRAGETGPIRFEADEFRLVSAGESTNVMNLANLYGEYCAAPRLRRAHLLQAFVRSWFDRYKEIPDQYEDLGPDLLPAIRPRMFHEAGRLEAEATGASALDLPYRVVGEHYAAGLVYDLPQSMMLVQGRHLASWGIGLDEALEAACDNLREISRRGLASPAPGVWASPWHDHYDAARLLIVADLIDPDDLDGDLVAMVPNRDTLLLAGARDDDALAALAVLAEEALKDPRTIHGYPLRRTYGTWCPYLPESDRPSFARLKRLAVRSIGRDYAEQSALLAALHKKSDETALVGNYRVLENPRTGESLGCCVWCEGIATLLPEADQVSFVRPRGGKHGEVLATAPWDRVVQVAGHLMTPAGLYPERYRVVNFPTDAQLAELGRA
jgi:hypothetical protein